MHMLLGAEACHERTGINRMYCLDCGYNLKGLSTRACPECGRAFEPTNLTTFAASGRKEPGSGDDELAEFGKQTILWIAFVLMVVGTAVGAVLVYLWPLL
jgi:hypothetical protein